MYKFTNKGEDIALESGLDRLAHELVEEDDYGPTLNSAISEYPFTNEQEIIDEDMISTYLYIIDRDELGFRRFVRASEIDEEDSWKYHTGQELTEGRLYPVEGIEKLTEVNVEVDRLILSGLLGYEVGDKYSIAENFLSPWSINKYGFNNEVEASGFLGAYVLKKVIEIENSGNSPSYESYPCFSTENGNTIRRVELFHDLHGDFRIREITQASKGVIDPLGQSAEYAPAREVVVCGYHSIEVDIAMAMIEDCLNKQGIDGLKAIIGEFHDTAIEFINGIEGVINDSPDIAPYADYGYDNTLDLPYEKLEYLIDRMQSDNIPHHRSATKYLLRGPVLPHSSVTLDIMSVDDGICFVNKDNYIDSSSADSAKENRFDVNGHVSRIYIKRTEYASLFSSLLLQAHKFGGRTSVTQHIDLVSQSHELMLSLK